MVRTKGLTLLILMGPGKKKVHVSEYKPIPQ